MARVRSVLTGLPTCDSRPSRPYFMTFHAGLCRSMECSFPCAGSMPTRLSVCRPSVVGGQPTYYDRHRCAHNADHVAHIVLLSGLFTEVVCTVGATPTNTMLGLSPNGGNGVIRGTTRRRHAANQLLMLQNPPITRQEGTTRTEQPGHDAWERLQRPRPRQLNHHERSLGSATPPATPASATPPAAPASDVPTRRVTNPQHATRVEGAGGPDGATGSRRIKVARNSPETSRRLTPETLKIRRFSMC